MSDTKKKTYVKIGKLYKNDRNGDIYFSGPLGAARAYLFKSKFPSKEGSEVWNLMLAEPEQQPQQLQHQPAYSSPQEFE